MISLTLSSDPAVKLNPNNSPQDFETRLSKPIILPINKQYEVCLSNMTASYSWHNIENSRNNTLIKYSVDNGTTWKNIQFIDGIYSYSDINNYIHDVMFTNGDYTVVGGLNVFDINLDFSLTSFLCTFTLTGTYQLDLYTSNFGSLLGFDTLLLTTTTSSSKFPNITNSIESIYIHCSLINESIVDGEYGDVIFVFSTSTLNRSYSFEKEPSNLIYHKLNSNIIQSIRMSFTDNANRLIDLNSISTSYTLLIREK